MTILYEIANSLYVNITNHCPCDCTFCLRNEGESVGGSGSLWLEREPELSEIIEEFKKWDLSKYSEVVFCGYGEPLERIYEVVEVCKYIRSISKIKIRLNTNGLANLIHGKNTEIMLEGLMDSVSISLNAPSKEEYLALCKPKFGIKSFDSLLLFAEEVKQYVKEVQFSVVDDITSEQIQRCKELSMAMNIPLRVRCKQ
ncbi:MAG: TIGR04100 family radical SAM protein [Clostridium sp.]